MRVWLLPVLGCCCLFGCASFDPHAQPPAQQRVQRDDALGECARMFQVSDRLVDEAGTRDAQSTRVPGFPHLRVDRVLTQLAPRVGDPVDQVQEWHAALVALDDTDRGFELVNANQVAAVSVDALAVCRQRLAVADRDEMTALLAAARVPDDYSTSQRALGLYLLTRYAFAAGIRRWQEETLAGFAAHTSADPGAHRRQRYVPTSSPQSLPMVRNLPALGLPVISRSLLASLIMRHAPQLEIETEGAHDHPGELVWQHDGVGPAQIGVAPESPTLYVRTGHAQLGGRWLLQLSYTIWFAARPPTQAHDLLAGQLDGLLWRVTLAEDGAPLVYDTIHPCGCYHLFVPSERLRAWRQEESIDEGLFAPQALRAPAVDERVVLKLAAGTHYLQQVEVVPSSGKPGIALNLHDEDQLRALPLPGGGTRSAFGPDGLIAGSERLERFYFWPMGILSAGQMRQWGRHATAFVGRRHFDDPTLLDRYFEYVPQSEEPAGGGRPKP